NNTHLWSWLSRSAASRSTAFQTLESSRDSRLAGVIPIARLHRFDRLVLFHRFVQPFGRPRAEPRHRYGQFVGSDANINLDFVLQIAHYSYVTLHVAS